MVVDNRVAKAFKNSSKTVDTQCPLCDSGPTHGKHKIQNMRTKALLGLAALAAGALTASAQSSVYSLNVVGYYNIPVPAKQFVMIANQLNTTNNTLSSLLPAPPFGSQVYKYNGGYSIYTFDDIENAWLPNGNATLNPGEGAFFISEVATTLTFVGEVLQGNLTNTVPLNAYSIRSSMVPQAGLVSAVLGLPAEAGDQVYVYRNGYTIHTFDDLEAAWLPSEPSINVGESFFLSKDPASTKNQWVRNFTVQ